MTPADVATLTVSILAGLSALVASLAALLQAFRLQSGQASIKNDLNGRLDQLLAEREERVRLAYQLDAQQRHGAAPLGRPDVSRPNPIIRHFPPDAPTEE
jgi:hypothetical protein